MKHTFVLDENVIHAALNCSRVANNLLRQISENFHMLAVHSDLYEEYWQILRVYNTSFHHPYIQPIIGGILRDSERCEFLSGPFQDSKQLPLRHRKDVFLAQIAANVNSPVLIVTMDRKTRMDLSRMGFHVLTLTQALVCSQQ